MSNTITVRTPADLVTIVATVLGFVPNNSLVVLSFGGGPTARVDLAPEAIGVLMDAYNKHPGVVAVLAFTDEPSAETRAILGRLTGLLSVQSKVVESLIVTGGEFQTLDSGISGTITQADRTAMDAQRVLSGRGTPAASREDVGRTLDGDTEPVRTALQSAPRLSDDEVSEALTVARLTGLVPDADTIAGITLALDNTETRDAVLFSIDRVDAAAHVAVWTQIVRATPRMYRASSAAILGWAAWIGGNGALAWLAYDSMDDEARTNRLVEMLALVLELAINPNCWDEFRTTLGQ